MKKLNYGALPQLPAGGLLIGRFQDHGFDCASLKSVDVTGLAALAGGDPEPEFVDIFQDGRIVLSLQENNYLVVADGRTGKVETHFSAGAVDIKNIDTKKDGRIALRFTKRGCTRAGCGSLDRQQPLRHRNEGDWKGGSRGLRIFNKDGSVSNASGASFEHEIVAHGHYPNKRNKKGAEVEGVEVGRYGSETLMRLHCWRQSPHGCGAGTRADAPERNWP